MDIFERFSDEKLPDKKCFYRFFKDGTADDNSEKSNGHVRDEEYLTCLKT